MTEISKREIIRRRNIIGGAYLEKGSSADNLAIALGTYFSVHMDRPDGDEGTESDDNYHQGDWVLAKINEALDLIAVEIWKAK